MVQANANQIWKFQRYQLIMEYAHRPVLVPPLIILNHIHLMYEACFRRCCRCTGETTRCFGGKTADQKLSKCPRELGNWREIYLASHDFSAELPTSHVINCLFVYFYYLYCNSEYKLSKEDLHKLMLFEEQCSETFLRQKNTLFNATSEERVRVIGERYTCLSHCGPCSTCMTIAIRITSFVMFFFFYHANAECSVPFL